MTTTAEAPSIEYEMSIKTARLEQEYEKALADSARLLDTERDRARRMENLLLRFECDALQSQLDHTRENLLGTRETERETRQQLDGAFQEIDRLDTHAQLSSNEIAKLKDELSTLNNTSTDYSSLLTEKFQLSKELSKLQIELDRHRNQVSSFQTMVAEKLELERQLNSLEVQLENEKNAHERTRAKNSLQAAEIVQLSGRIEDLQGELTREQRAKQQQERDSRQQSAEWDCQRSILEGRIETLKKQLRTSKDTLHETQHQRRSNVKSEDEVTESRSRTVPLQRPGPGADYQNGVTIATPGAVRVQDKIKRQSALPGDKSAFSITPFLNRTGAPRHSPTSSEADEQESRRAINDHSTAAERGKRMEDIMDERSSPEDPSCSTSAQAFLPRVVKGKPKARESKSASRPAKKIPLEEMDEPQEPPVEQGQAKLKKRKLGTQRERKLFEDDEEDGSLEIKNPGRKLGLGLGGGRSSVLASSQVPGTSGDRLPRNLGFGAPVGFSPLKRDRKRL
ncbi:hypothetical protein N7532_003394 [Penicillium argentinense]|uniref:Uncharacterized protein n=1 Tax=Penicillium argentinense TaxID=1131581 RepID=A0A9W9FMC9_9EURO|nr:uncharacterized protein N7532_003394 [Penicillium argentinense]KAJ5102865.1 hypothetical protein N7532_003394 [Penicillium argentinense]